MPGLDHLSYDEALAVLRRALVFGMNPSLDGITELCDALGRPQDRFRTVQVTGTNGKTSTARMTAALLRGQGQHVGLYTSPHLERFNERIELDGEPVSDTEFATALGAVLEAAHALRPDEPPGTPAGFTEFELLTAAALWQFAERSVDVAVLEVGLGGRWDATSVARASVAVITGVGLDHTAILGDTLEAIAAEKAAIIHPEGVPVLGPGTDGLDSIFLGAADLVGAHPRAVREDLDFSPVAEELTIRFRVLEWPDSPDGYTMVSVDGVHGRYPALALSGPAYQAANIATAIGAAEAALGQLLHVESARSVLRALTLPGRFELLRERPPVIVDGSHNPQAALTLARAIREAFPDPHARPLVLLGILADKDARGIISALAPVASGIAVTQSDSPRAMPVGALAELVTEVTGAAPAGVFDSVPAALGVLLGEARDGLVVTGSITTAGEARTALRNA